MIRRYLTLGLLAFALSACTTQGRGLAAGGALLGYCNGLTEQARVVVRNALTGGVQVVNCPRPQTQAPPPSATTPAPVIGS